MMHRLILAAAALLAGCTAVPTDLLDNGIHVERKLQYAPAVATRCIERNVERESGAIVNYSFTEQGPRGIDIYTHKPGEFVQTVVAIRIRPTDQGAVADAWIAPSAYFAPREFAERLMSRC